MNRLRYFHWCPCIASLHHLCVFLIYVIKSSKSKKCHTLALLLGIRIISPHCGCSITHSLYLYCHNNPWMPACDSTLTARALTWWERWKQKHDSTRALTACSLFYLIEFHCVAVWHIPFRMRDMSVGKLIIFLFVPQFHEVFGMPCRSAEHMFLIQDGSTSGQPRKKHWHT